MEPFLSRGVEHFPDKLIKSESRLFYFELQTTQLNVLTLDILVELSITASNAHHYRIHIKVSFDDSCAEHVLSIFDHFDGHPDIILLDQLGKPLVARVTLLGRIVNSLLEQVLGACRHNTITVDV